MFMFIAFFVGAFLLLGLLIRYGTIVFPVLFPVLAVPFLVAYCMSCMSAPDHRAYDPDVFTDAQLQDAVTVKISNGQVTLINKSDRVFESEFFVLCMADETVLVGDSKWVMGIHQYPFIFHSDRKKILSKSIETVDFDQMTDKGPFTNLLKCALYTREENVVSAKKNINDKWVSITPEGAAFAAEMGFNVPQATGIDYTNPWTPARK